MKLSIINLLPESSHKRVIDEASTTHRVDSVINHWYCGESSIGYYYVTDGDYLYCKDYWSENSKAILIGEVINGKRTLYDYTNHFKYDNRNIKIESKHRATYGVFVARNVLVRNLNWSLPKGHCTRFEFCRTYHRKSTNCSGLQIRFHGKKRRIIKTHNLYDVYKYENIPFFKHEEFDAVFSALSKGAQIVKPRCV